MADGSLFIHRSAREAHEQITQLSDFISPTIVAMWNLRWQVRGFLEAVPAATQSDLVNRFALRSGVRGNEIKRACVDVSWQEHESRFAAILLTNTFAIFEDFLENLASLTMSDSQRRSVVKALQFPDSAKQAQQSGYPQFGPIISEINGVFVVGAKNGKHYAGSYLHNLLLCYRFFKEMRNAMIHNGGRAGPKLISAYAAFQPVATPAALGMVAVPKHSVPVLGQSVSPILDGVNLFSNVVLRIIATYDADVGDREGAFLDIGERLGSIAPGKRQHLMRTDKREKLIHGMLRNSHLPPATLTADFVAFLKRTSRMPNFW